MHFNIEPGLMHFNTQSELETRAGLWPNFSFQERVNSFSVLGAISRSHVKITVLLLITPVTYIPDSRLISLMQVLCSGAIAIKLSRSKGTRLLGLWSAWHDRSSFICLLRQFFLYKTRKPMPSEATQAGSWVWFWFCDLVTWMVLLTLSLLFISWVYNLPTTWE